MCTPFGQLTCSTELRSATTAAVVVEDGVIVGVEDYGFPVPEHCPILDHEGTLLPGLIDAHTHLVADNRVGALDRVAGYSPRRDRGGRQQGAARPAGGRRDYGP